MNRPEHDDSVKFFIGTEVEHTPAFGKKTLFVVGIQDTEQIKSIVVTNSIEHVYFGANQSFPKIEPDSEYWLPWVDMVMELLYEGHLCTLDIDVSCAEGLMESPLCEQVNFIPMISVKLPYLQLLGYNATIKIDDKDFKATNHGVWCHQLHNLLDRSKFTDWSKYTKDEVIK